jgi:hypothetical protein
VRPCSPFAADERLPEVEAMAGSNDDLAQVVDQIQRLRDRIDDVLYGAQDFAVLGVKPR